MAVPTYLEFFCNSGVFKPFSMIAQIFRPIRQHNKPTYLQFIWSIYMVYNKTKPRQFGHSAAPKNFCIQSVIFSLKCRTLVLSSEFKIQIESLKMKKEIYFPFRTADTFVCERRRRTLKEKRALILELLEWKKSHFFNGESRRASKQASKQAGDDFENGR